MEHDLLQNDRPTACVSNWQSFSRHFRLIALAYAQGKILRAFPKCNFFIFNFFTSLIKLL
jgi:hypothetical protein